MRIRLFVVPPLLLCAGWGLLFRYAPWRQVPPWDSTLARALGRAPIWTHVYDSLPGARVDGAELLAEATAVLLLSVVILNARRLLTSVTS